MSDGLIDEETMKYSIGDKVYAVGNLDFLGNPYHFKSALGAFYTVKVADARRFSINERRELHDVCGMDMWEVNCQDNGRPLYSNRVLLHVEQDREAIITAMDKVINEFLAEAQKKKQDKITANRAKIKALEAEIADIEQNGVTFGFNSIRMVPFIEKNKSELLEKLKP